VKYARSSKSPLRVPNHPVVNTAKAGTPAEIRARRRDPGAHTSASTVSAPTPRPRLIFRRVKERPRAKATHRDPLPPWRLVAVTASEYADAQNEGESERRFLAAEEHDQWKARDVGDGDRDRDRCART